LSVIGGKKKGGSTFPQKKTKKKRKRSRWYCFPIIKKLVRGSSVRGAYKGQKTRKVRMEGKRPFIAKASWIV